MALDGGEQQHDFLFFLKYFLRRDKFHLTLSLADGASARVSAINASLRIYHPSFMHFWQLKTYCFFYLFYEKS